MIHGGVSGLINMHRLINGRVLSLQAKQHGLSITPVCCWLVCSVIFDYGLIRVAIGSWWLVICVCVEALGMAAQGMLH